MGTSLIRKRPQDPTVGLRLEPYGGPMGGAVSYERGTHVSLTLEVCTGRCRVNVAQIRQARPDSGIGFQVKVLIFFKLFPPRSEAGRLLVRRGKYL